MVKKQKVRMTIRNNTIIHFEQEIIEGWDVNFLQFHHGVIVLKKSDFRKDS